MRFWGIIVAGLALAGPAPAQAFELGAADDAHLVGSFREGTVESMAANGVTTLRLTAWQGREHSIAIRSAIAAQQAGLKVQVVLGVTAGETPDDSFPRWAARTAREFADVGAHRFSVLNEPDLWIPALDRCDTDDEVRRTIVEAGYRKTTRRIKTRVRRTKVVSRVTRVRGKRTIVRKRVPMFKVVRRAVRVRGRSAVRRVRVPLYRTCYTTKTVLVATSNPRVVTMSTPKQGCLGIHRARAANRTYDSTVPAVRMAVPGAEILLGETSPQAGSVAFIREAVRLGLPNVQGWAHHPYPWHDAELETGLAYAQTVNQLVDLPVFWTEFGSPVRDNGGTLENAKVAWKRAEKKALELGVRQLVAYGWWETRMSWDTAAEGVLF